MFFNDPVADLLTRLRNAHAARQHKVTLPASRLCQSICEVLEREGYIRAVSVADVRPGVRQMTVELKYYEGQPVIQMAKRVSKPGRRIYSAIAELPRVFNGMGIAILSTSQGILSDSEARERNVGGEVLCTVL